ncbi:bifunctional protein-disulfide isomerase/oxidoreductase DsbC [Alteromonadaceae bacterium BrNp21-10]|nr:bifunctional protein-disulfide isomerase/oxidoreductase DsbC [Alteromonadaceae bacterium BrNp21-10]
MKKKIALIVVTIGFITSGLVFSQQSATKKPAIKDVAVTTPDDNAALKMHFQQSLGMSVKSIKDAPMSGLKELVTDRGLFYSSADGQFFIQGRLYNLTDGLVNETEKSLQAMRTNGLNEFTPTAIHFPAKDERYKVTIFTDITCGYCRQLHSQMDQYNALGISVDYLAYPRGGLNSQSYQDLVSIWCAADPKEALTEAKEGGDVEAKSCANNVRQQFEFAMQIGVNSTPSIVFPDGQMTPGYQPPLQLAQTLSQQ